MAAGPGSIPERGSSGPRYLITSARFHVLFSCWASATAFCAARATSSSRDHRARRLVGSLRSCLPMRGPRLSCWVAGRPRWSLLRVWRLRWGWPATPCG